MIEHVNNIYTFSTEIVEFQLTSEEANDILKEVTDLKDCRSSTENWYAQMQHPDIYYTNYAENNIIPSVEKVLYDLKTFYDTLDIDFEVSEYWTAAYRQTAGHEMHNHNSYIMDKPNYSGVLHLSDIGNTTFYSTSPSSVNNIYTTPSEKGKVVLFPSNLPHSVPTHGGMEWRYIVAFNASIYKRRSKESEQ